MSLLEPSLSSKMLVSHPVALRAESGYACDTYLPPQLLDATTQRQQDEQHDDLNEALASFENG